MPYTELDPQQVEGETPLVLRRLTTREHNLEGQDLRGSDFVLSDLSGSFLKGCDISFSNAAGGTFKHTDMRKVRARNVNFAFAALDYADLRNADLTGCCDWGTTWDGANLEGCTLPEGWLYEDFVDEVVARFFINCNLPLKSIVSDRGWTTGPIELAYPNGVPPMLKPVERRMRIFMKSGHLRRAQVTKALRARGVLR